MGTSIDAIDDALGPMSRDPNLEWVLDKVVVWQEDPARPIDCERLTDAWRRMFGFNLPGTSTADETFEGPYDGKLYLFNGGRMYGRTANGDYIAMTLEVAKRHLADFRQVVQFDMAEAYRRQRRLERLSLDVEAAEMRHNSRAIRYVGREVFDAHRKDGGSP